MSDSAKWDEIRQALRRELLSDTGATWWDEADIRHAVSEANAKGIAPDLILQCRAACHSHEEFLRRLRAMVDAGAAVEPSNGERRPRMRSKHRVFAVDDEEGFLELLKMNLERTGRYEVRTESDPTKVIAAAREFGADLVLLDVVMPGIDGTEILREMRSDVALRSTPVIMLTALAEDSPSGGVTKDGILYLGKPITIKRLLHCIDEHLGVG